MGYRADLSRSGSDGVGVRRGPENYRCAAWGSTPLGWRALLTARKHAPRRIR